MRLDPNTPYCETCKSAGGHRAGCPEVEESDEGSCGMCGMPLAEDEVQLCGDCSAAWPGD